VLVAAETKEPTTFTLTNYGIVVVGVTIVLFVITMIIQFLREKSN